MSTVRQTKVAKLLVENRKKGKNTMNGKEILEKAGYTKAVQTYPGKVINAKGVQEALSIVCKKSGLTRSLIAEALYNDIKNKPNNRVPELRLASEILGITKQGTEINVGIFNLAGVLEKARTSKKDK